MANTVKTRIQLKNDTEANWNKSHFIPLKGELIIYSTDESHPFFRLKAGDGTTYLTDLPFMESGGNGSVKTGTAEYWNSKLGFIPAPGEPIVYVDDNDIPRIKIGDGNSYLIDLPFIDEELMKIENHMDNPTIHVTEEERTFWNNKISCSDNVVHETLVLNKN